MEVGSRVVRGPDWMWGDQDGGEGNVGTVVQHGQDRNLPDGTVLVHWDSGRQANYRAGHSGKFDLRVLDCAQAGVKHTPIICDGCKQSPLAGTRWKCADCPNYNLCSPCFMNDMHNMHHSFLRFDISSGDGIPVGKRPNFTKQQSRGLFPGARVTRGRDWKWGDQDGGGGHVGQLTEITSWNGVERAGANVMWSLLSRNTYRTGHMGEVDLKCSSSAIGPPYYRECLAKLGENRRRLDSSRLRVGDRVSVCLDAEVLRAMSAGHGGWVDDMAKCIGKVGKISKIDADGDVHVSYGFQSWVFHPQAVTKVPSFQAGDKVRILSDKQLVQNLQQGHGGWNEKMTTALGKEGRILEVDSDGDAVVLVDSDLWLLNPAALEDMSEGGEATSRRGDTSPTSPVDRATDLLRMLLLEAVTSKGGSVDPGDRLVNASSNGNLQEVREILEAHPGKIDHKRGGKTALHVACHQGRKEIVQYLLGKGAGKDIKDEQDYSALHHAAYGDRSGETVTAMLNTGTNVNVSDNKNKSTPLHVAVNQGNDAGVRSLLASRHCDVNCQDLAGDTPLHDAISKEKNAIVELILRSERLEIFVCNGRGFNPLHQACMKGNLHAVQKIIDKYPGLVEIPKEDGFTALHLAAFNNHLDIARCLLLSGHCDINLRNNKRQTALALAVSEAYTGMIELLVEHGADVNADDEDGDTPLHLAVIHQAVGTTGLRGLLQGLGLNLPAGAETDQHTGSAIAVYLVLHGANVSFYNHEGKTPLDLCQDTQTAALIQQCARNAPSSVPQPPPTRTTGPSSSQPPVPPQPSTARSASGAAVERQKKTQDTVNRVESAGTDCIICSENVATVTFNPCGHKVTCSVCSMKLKHCITCKAAIQQKTSPEDDTVSISTLMDETDYAERIRLLESKLKAMAWIDVPCQICMERDQNTTFSCGHSACKECSERLINCHICGQTIESFSSTVPSEIIARGPKAKRAYLNAFKTGKVKVYRARIMLIGQYRAGKTSLKNSLLGLPFKSGEESTDGIDVVPCEVNTDQVKNWKRTDEKLGESQLASDLAKMVARDLQDTGDEGDERKNDKENEVEEKGEINPKQAGFDATEKLQGQETNVKPLMEEKKPASFKTQVDQDTSRESDVREETNTAVLTDLEIDPSLPPVEFMDHLVQLLKNVNRQSDTTVVEHHYTLDLWDFAGQHVYYASYPVFLSTRAVYILVYDLSKELNDTAQPCFKKGNRKIQLSNPNKETNLENLLSWLVSLRTMCSLKPDGNEWKTNAEELSYCRPPVFIVGTHADKPYQDIEEIEWQIQQEICGKEYAAHVIRPFFTVDNTQGSSDERVVALQKQIMEVLKKEPYMGEEVPIRWFNFEKVVKALTAKKWCYLPLEQLQGIIRRFCFIEDEDEVATMLDFYHDLGLIVRHGNTVVLRAQWLIEVFRQLITIRSFNKMEARHTSLWKEMEKTGALDMELVDHVFSKCCQQQGLIKEDILNMMEQFGLIVKFITSPTNEMYFVPCQLKTPPKTLFEMEPSPSDPCALYLHFLGGFVPHGFFWQLVSRITKWCSKSGFGQPPRFFLAASRFVIKKKSIHKLTLLCKKRFVKVILRHSEPVYGESFTEAKEVAILVRTFLEETVRDLRRELPWLSNLKCDFCVVCPGCQQKEEKCSNHDAVSCDHEDCLFFRKILDEGQLSDCPNNICFKENTRTVEGLEKWFPGKAIRPGHHPGTDDDYNMTARPRGITLVINNASFTPHPRHGQQSPRHGSEEDVRQVEELFIALGFEVQRRQNLSRQELENELRNVLCRQDHSGYDCFVLWLMSHGRSGEVFCSDGNTLPIQAVHDMFSRCDKLTGKPKLFFIQACRGDDEDEGVAACSDLSPSHVDSPSDSVENPGSREPTHADFLYAFSTVDEYVSYRDKHLGSHYVRGLVEAFRERAVYDHLLDILTVVNKKVSNMEVKRPSGANNDEIKICKQMPEVKHTLRKKVRF